MSLVGSVLQGKLDAYEVEEVFVSGRFGHTFLARRVSDKDDVIVKMVRLDRKADWEVLDLFERESERLRGLNHPYIAPYIDSVVVQGEDETLLGLVQTYVTTPSLRDWREGRGFVDLDKCLDWFEQVLEALVYMHEHTPPLVHGDLDAGNILISDQHKIKIVDFATARQAVLSAPTLASGLAVGTLDYAPMEQLVGKIFPSSDLYALAMTFLAVVSKTEPETFPLDGMRPALKEILPYDTPEALRALLFQMTEPDPQHRLASARIALERLKAARLNMSGRIDEVREPEAAREDFDIKLDSSAGESERVVKGDDRERRDRALGGLVQNVSELYTEHPGLKPWRFEFRPEYERVHAFGVAADGVTMVVAHHHDAYVLDSDSLQMRGDVEFSEVARRIAVSRDGQRIAILTGFEELLLYEVNVSLWKKHKIVVDGMWPGNSQLTFSPDGNTVAISDDDQVNLYMWSTGSLVDKWEVDGQFSLTFSPDSKVICAGGAEGITIIDGAQHTFDASTQAMAFSPDGTMLAMIQGSNLIYGHYQSFKDGVVWNHDERVVNLPGYVTKQRAHMLRFSPDQQWLFVGCASGGFALIDLEKGEVLSLKDNKRATDRDHVKLFDVGFSPDSRRLFVHGTLLPDELGHERLGALGSWSVPDGRFLGSLMWLDNEMGVVAAEGFYGRVKDAASRGFSSDVWERSDVAASLFRGKDVATLLDAKERASLGEFTARYRAMKKVAYCYNPPLNVQELTDAMAGVSHVAPAVFAKAEESYNAKMARENRLTEPKFVEEVGDVAYDFDAENSDEGLMVMHREILKNQSSDTPRQQEPSRPSSRGVARASDMERREEREEPSEDQSYGDGGSSITVSDVASREERESYKPRNERAPKPGRGLSEPISAIHRDHDHEGGLSASMQPLAKRSNAGLRFVIAAALGFGLTGLFAVIAVDSDTIVANLLPLFAVGLVLTLALHFGHLKQMMRGS